MSSNRADDAAGRPPGNGWLSSLRRLSLVRLLVFFAVLLAGDIAAQLAKVWAIRHSPTGAADWVAIGGRFGPEASVVAIAVCLAAAIVLLVLAVRNGRWIPMRRRPLRSAA